MKNHNNNTASLVKFNLETKRLLLRPVELRDIDDMAALLADPDVMRFSLAGAQTVEQTLQIIRKKSLESFPQHNYGMWAMINKETQQFIGFCGIDQKMIENKTCLELFYRIAKDMWGNGYTPEAAKAIKEYVFATLHIPQLVSLISPENIASIRVAEKNEFQHKYDAIFHGFDVKVYVHENPKFSPRTTD